MLVKLFEVERVRNCYFVEIPDGTPEEEWENAVIEAPRWNQGGVVETLGNEIISIEEVTE